MFRVDAEGLAELAAALEALDEVYAEKLALIESHVGAMAREWTGEAAEADTRLHAAWQAAAAQMRSGAAELQVAMDAAHQNYRSAGTTNTGMWHG